MQIFSEVQSEEQAPFALGQGLKLGRRQQQRQACND